MTPRDAATIVVVDRSGVVPRVLMGRRRPDQIFLPNKFVFPGGRLDDADRQTPVASPLSETASSTLAIGPDNSIAGDPALAQALAIAALRELYEETGHLMSGATPIYEPPIDKTWSDLLASGLLPALAGLNYFARAITPPGRPRRYDTRFFVADASSLSFESSRRDGELSEIGWFTLDDVRHLELPSITRLIVEDLASLLNDAGNQRPEPGIPFYFYRDGVFERALLSQFAASA